jgi:5-methylcytosine-specific restriction endonuclease McrA
MRLRACAYCGRIHPADFICEKKPKRKEKKTDTEAVRIRNTSRWQYTRQHIRERDNNLCQLCLRNYQGTRRQIEYQDLSVHHIIALEEDKSKAFDCENLITLCDIHHEMAEQGLISKAELKDIAKEQEIAWGNPRKIPPSRTG